MDVTGDVRLCRDPDDDVVIETAIAGHANALVTRDDDLKSPEISEILASRGIAVLTVRRLVEVFDPVLTSVQWPKDEHPL